MKGKTDHKTTLSSYFFTFKRRKNSSN